MLPELLCCVTASLNANPVCLWLTAGPKLFCFSASLQSKQDVCSYIFLILSLPWLLLVTRLAQLLVPAPGKQANYLAQPKGELLLREAMGACPGRNNCCAMVRGGNPRSSESLSKAREEMPDKFLIIRGREAPSFWQVLSLLHLRGLRTALLTAGKEPLLETAAPWGRARGLMWGWAAPGHTQSSQDTHSRQKLIRRLPHTLQLRQI